MQDHIKQAREIIDEAGVSFETSYDYERMLNALAALIGVHEVEINKIMAGRYITHVRKKKEENGDAGKTAAGSNS